MLHFKNSFLAYCVLEEIGMQTIEQVLHAKAGAEAAFIHNTNSQVSH